LIKVRIVGGLGNQLFQLGVASLMSLRTGYPVGLDLSALRSYKTPREFTAAKLFDLDKAFPAGHAFIKSSVLGSRIARVVGVSTPLFALVNDKNVCRVLKADWSRGDLFVDGYFIESIDQEAFDDWTGFILDSLRTEKDIDPDTCAIHIRGGDFLKLGWDASAGKESYIRLVDQVLMERPKAKLVVATDDAKYASHLLEDLSHPWEFSGGNEISDFQLLLHSEFAIIGNSTFSFCARAFAERLSKSTKTFASKEWRPGIERKLKLPSERGHELL